jgi:hypothetical protein
MGDGVYIAGIITQLVVVRADESSIRRALRPRAARGRKRADGALTKMNDASGITSGDTGAVKTRPQNKHSH